MRYVIIVFLAVLFPSACPAQQELTNRSTGIVLDIIDIKAYPCFDAYEGKLPQTEYVIDSEGVYSRYKEFFQTCDFPDVDFSKHTLIGMYAGGNNYCNVEYFRNVENDKSNARYIFTLTVLQKGFCKRIVRWHWHWVLVPRLPESYEVKFKVNRIRDKEKAGENKKQISLPNKKRAKPDDAGQ